MKTNYSQLNLSVGKEKVSVFSLIGWIILLSLACYFIYTNALRYFNFSNPVYTPGPTGNKPFAPFLVTHVAGGVIALLIGPLQFFPILRKRYVRMHRNIGKMYLLCIVLSGVAATYLAIVHNLFIKKEFVFGTGVLGMALAWFLTAGMALWAIKQRNFLQHQEWMVRSYVLTSNFILFRLMFYGLLGMEGFPFKGELGGVTAWASWSLPLLITEVLLQARKIQAQSKKQLARQVV
jgi:uncharacterized membrane protein YozB (DUF420 family)